MTRHATVRTRIAAFTTDPTVRRELEEALGICDDAGNLLPDDVFGRNTPVQVNRLAADPMVPSKVFNTPSLWTRDERPKQSTAPEALRNLAPIKAPEPRTAKAKTATAGPARNAPAPCGTKTAQRRHKRNDETCEVCDKARIERRPARKTGSGRTYERQPCGTPAAYQRHSRAGEPIDDACREAFRAWRPSRKKDAA